MKYYACDNCLLLIRVHGDPDIVQRLILEHSLWKDGLPCVSEGCGEKLKLLTKEEGRLSSKASDSGLIRVVDLTAEEFFNALCGYGMPDELGAQPEVVKALLLSAKVLDVEAAMAPSGRTILSKLSLDNGTCVHLASSSYGPAVLKVTRRRDGQEHHDFGDVQEDSTRGAARHEGCCGRCGSGAVRGGDGGDLGDEGSGTHTQPDRQEGGPIGGGSLGHTQVVEGISGCGCDDAACTDEAHRIRQEGAAGLRVR